MQRTGWRRPLMRSVGLKTQTAITIMMDMVD
jgi:hypothetical protein